MALVTQAKAQAFKRGPKLKSPQLATHWAAGKSPTGWLDTAMRETGFHAYELLSINRWKVSIFYDELDRYITRICVDASTSTPVAAHPARLTQHDL